MLDECGVCRTRAVLDEHIAVGNVGICYNQVLDHVVRLFSLLILRIVASLGSEDGLIDWDCDASDIDRALAISILNTDLAQ